MNACDDVRAITDKRVLRHIKIIVYDIYFGLDDDQKDSKLKASGIDTSKSGLEQVGIKLTDEQYNQLCTINQRMALETQRRIPVFYGLIALRTLGIIPDHLENERNSFGEDEKYDRLFGMKKEELGD